MPTFRYRVYLARPETKKGIWDYAATIIAKNKAEAIKYAYDNWQEETSRTNSLGITSLSVPELKDCRSNVELKND